MSNVRYIPVTTEDGTKLVLEVYPFHTHANGKVLANFGKVMYQDPESTGVVREFPAPKELA